MVLTFHFLDEVLKCDCSNESYEALLFSFFSIFFFQVGIIFETYESHSSEKFLQEVEGEDIHDHLYLKLILILSFFYFILTVKMIPSMG